MIFNEINGFSGSLFSRLDDESIKAVMPEFDFNVGCKEASETWKKWKKENETTGITQTEFSKKYNIVNLQGVFKSECLRKSSDQEKELQKRMNVFISENKEEIYNAQVAAINLTNQATKEYNKKRKEQKEQQEEEHFNKYKETVSQYLEGHDLAISTLAKDDTKDFINLLLKNGYKVRCASASLVFLYYDAEEKLTLEQVQKIVPYEPLYNGYDRYTTHYKYSPTYLMEPVKGVRIPVEAHFIDKEYPRYELEYEPATTEEKKPLFEM